MDSLGGAEYVCDPDKRFSQIVVPTVDTVGGYGGGWGRADQRRRLAQQMPCKQPPRRRVTSHLSRLSLRKVRYLFLLEALLARGHHALVVGETGEQHARRILGAVADQLQTASPNRLAVLRSAGTASQPYQHRTQ
jgi:hypothetical protein